ncbi:MAG: transcriptional regulator [Acidobacteria bacterium]|nr:MAG: transcriptional regulator [Acidobacteriota bacterium]
MVSVRKAPGRDGPDAVERVELVMGVIAGKWKPAIIYALVTKGTLRFNELRRLIPRVSQRMLTQQLRDLERHGLVDRVLYPEIPPRVEYSMTRLGRSLHPIFKSVCNWAEKNFDDVESAVTRHATRPALLQVGARRRRIRPGPEEEP